MTAFHINHTGPMLSVAPDDIMQTAYHSTILFGMCNPITPILCEVPPV